jgi:hypothetical protein
MRNRMKSTNVLLSRENHYLSNLSGSAELEKSRYLSVCFASRLSPHFSQPSVRV